MCLIKTFQLIKPVSILNVFLITGVIVKVESRINRLVLFFSDVYDQLDKSGSFIFINTVKYSSLGVLD